jgi:hypothetical protein
VSVALASEERGPGQTAQACRRIGTGVALAVHGINAFSQVRRGAFEDGTRVALLRDVH